MTFPFGNQQAIKSTALWRGYFQGNYLLNKEKKKPSACSEDNESALFARLREAVAHQEKTLSADGCLP